MKKLHVLPALLLGAASLGLSANVSAAPASVADLGKASLGISSAKAKLGAAKLTHNENKIKKHQKEVDAAKAEYNKLKNQK